SRSSAGNNMSNLEEFNQRYAAVMKYYGVKPQHTNPVSPHENGDAEQSHHRFKRAVDQALMLRGSRDFSSQAEYVLVAASERAKVAAPVGPRRHGSVAVRV